MRDVSAEGNPQRKALEQIIAGGEKEGRGECPQKKLMIDRFAQVRTRAEKKTKTSLLELFRQA